MVSPRLELHAAPTHMASPRLELRAAPTHMASLRLELRAAQTHMALPRLELRTAHLRLTWLGISRLRLRVGAFAPSTRLRFGGFSSGYASVATSEGLRPGSGFASKALAPAPPRLTWLRRGSSFARFIFNSHGFAAARASRGSSAALARAPSAPAFQSTFSPASEPASTCANARNSFGPAASGFR